MMKFNDIGSPGLHKHHTIEITEKENVGRALVLDQHIIDVLFTQKKLDARQHRACNKYLDGVLMMKFNDGRLKPLEYLCEDITVEDLEEVK